MDSHKESQDCYHYGQDIYQDNQDRHNVRLVTKTVLRIIRISSLMVRKETGFAKMDIVIIIVRLNENDMDCT